MTEDRICATATGLPRRSFLAGAAILPATYSAPAFGMTEPEGGLSAYDRGFRDGQRREVEVFREEFSGIAPEAEEKIAPKLRRLTREMSAALDELAFDLGDTEWHLTMTRDDITGVQSSGVRFTGYKGQAGSRKIGSVFDWDLK